MSERNSRTDVREIDVRPLLTSGQGPLGAILEAVRSLAPGQALRLIAPFEPAPLYAKLGDMGFSHATRRRDDGVFEITFTPGAPRRPDPVLLDLRGLEPPQPMMRVLEELDALPAGGAIVALTRFRPVHLLEILEERGYAAETAEQPDGSHETIIQRAG
ncbi:MAG: DUF2249 domain-containing protein [Opitutaceae bacterium]|nr:DUF2249 domain-containing protein [Opitutaceae bacterium]